MNIKERYKQILAQKEELFEDVLKDIFPYIPNGVTHRGFSETSGITLSVSSWILMKKTGIKSVRKKPISLEGIMQIREDFITGKIVIKHTTTRTVLKGSNGSPFVIMNGVQVPIDKNEVEKKKGKYYLTKNGIVYTLKESKNELSRYDLKKLDK